MKKQEVAVVKITAQKTKFDFDSEEIEVVLGDDNYEKLTNQLFRFIAKKLEDIHKNG